MSSQVQDTELMESEQPKFQCRFSYIRMPRKTQIETTITGFKLQTRRFMPGTFDKNGRLPAQNPMPWRKAEKPIGIIQASKAIP